MELLAHSFQRLHVAGVLLLVFTTFVGCGSSRAVDSRLSDEGGAAWAVPIHREGIPNFYKVDDNLYRGGQPTEEGFRQLEQMGVKTIINVRSVKSDEDLIKGTNLRYIEIPSSSYTMDEQELVQFIKAVNDPHHGPYFIHCHYGADRTGAMVAAYRIVYHRWLNQDALNEMREGGFHFNELCVRLPPLIRRIDREELCRLAGITQPATPLRSTPKSTTSGLPAVRNPR
ncbi:MAG: dual specificity protein phosphatase family protein [Phycisphaeraceae bacterium]|nr:dual specificity protein phosphatase family protein [Phycisphaeraceae bacterium]